MHPFAPAVLVTRAGFTWRFTGGRLGPSEICKRSQNYKLRL